MLKLVADVYLRKASLDDMDLLYLWANDVTARENAFSEKKIEYENHKKWFIKKLESSESVIYIYVYHQIPIGQARVDVENDYGLISYSIDCAYRLQGHGRMLLQLMEAYIKIDLPTVTKLLARVKNINIASQHIFDRLYYRKTKMVGYIEYEKDIGINATAMHLPEFQ